VGKGTIVGELGDGLYSLKLDYGKAELDAKIDRLTDRQAELEDEADTLESERINAANAAAAATAALNPLITAYSAALIAGLPGTEEKEAVIAQQEASGLARNALQQAETKANLNKAALSAVKKQISYLQGLDLDKTISAWCVDLTENATGEVGTIEVPGEPKTTLIVPDCAPPSPEDGEIVARALQSPEQVYLNAAILPGWQKYRPTYRIGTISNIDTGTDTASVALSTAKSSAQNLDINQDTLLSSVPVEYMNCHASAFLDDDEVVVKFEGQDWNNPKIIGFRSNPRSCAPHDVWFLVEVAQITETQQENMGWKFQGWPVTEGGPIGEPFPRYYVTPGDIIGSERAGRQLNYSLKLHPDPNSQGSYNPTNSLFLTASLRIRFDTAWTRKKETDLLYKIDSNIEILSHDVWHDLDPETGTILPEGGTFAAGAFVSDYNVTPWEIYGPTGWSLDPAWIPQVSPLPWRVVDSFGNGEIITDPLLDTYYGTQPDDYKYFMAGWSGLNWDRRRIFYENDLDHASEWLLQAFNPPQNITLDVNGSPIEYVFVRIGGAPKCEQEFRIISPATPPSVLGLIGTRDTITYPYQTNGEGQLAVLYQRAP
jgi:hypothetical protein